MAVSPATGELADELESSGATLPVAVASALAGGAGGSCLPACRIAATNKVIATTANAVHPIHLRFRGDRGVQTTGFMVSIGFVASIFNAFSIQPPEQESASAVRPPASRPFPVKQARFYCIIG